MSDIVILDRDGVINLLTKDYVKSAAEWQPIPGSIQAIAQLSQAGLNVVVATNQPGISHGLFNVDELEAIHTKLVNHVEEAGGKIAGIFYCPHSFEDSCHCRKPSPGLLDTIEAELQSSVEGAAFVGDSLIDLQCALAKDCMPLLVKTGYGEQTVKQLEAGALSDSELKQIKVFPDLLSTCGYVFQSMSF